MDPLSIQIKEEPEDDEYSKYLQTAQQSIDTIPNIAIKSEPELTIIDYNETLSNSCLHNGIVKQEQHQPHCEPARLVSFKVYKCSDCNKEFARERSLKIHQKFNMCKNQKNRNKNLNAAEWVPITKRENMEEKASKIERQIATAEKNGVTVNKIKVRKLAKTELKCPKCQVIFHTFSQLKHHIANKHLNKTIETTRLRIYVDTPEPEMDTRLLICHICSEIYPYQRDKYGRTISSPYKCYRCNNPYRGE